MRNFSRFLAARESKSELPWVIHQGVGEAKGGGVNESILVDHGRGGKESCKCFSPIYHSRALCFTRYQAGIRRTGASTGRSTGQCFFLFVPLMQSMAASVASLYIHTSSPQIDWSVW